MAILIILVLCAICYFGGRHSVLSNFEKRRIIKDCADTVDESTHRSKLFEDVMVSMIADGDVRKDECLGARRMEVTYYRKIER